MGKRAKKRQREEEGVVEALDLTLDKPKNVVAAGKGKNGNDEDEERLVFNKRSNQGNRLQAGAVMPADAHKGMEVDEDEDFVEAEEEGLAMAANAQLKENWAEGDFDLPGGLSASAAAHAGTKPKDKKSAAQQQQEVVEAVARDFVQLSESEYLQMIQEQSPEMLKLLEDFKTSLAQVKEILPKMPKLRELVSGKARSKAQTSETASLLQFLETKLQLLLSYCVHVNFYLLLKSEGKKVEGHPVIDRLIEIRVYLEKLWPVEQKMQYSLNKLLNGVQDGSRANLKKMRAVEEGAEGEVYRPKKSAALEADAQRRKLQAAQAAQEELEAEEESIMNRVRDGAASKKLLKKATKGKSAINEAVDAGQEPEDHFFSRVIRGSDDEDEDEDEDDSDEEAIGKRKGSKSTAGMSLIERIKARQERSQNAAAELKSSRLEKESKASKPSKKSSAVAAEEYDDDVEDDEEEMEFDEGEGEEEEGAELFDAEDEDEYQRLLAEEQEEMEAEETKAKAKVSKRPAEEDEDEDEDGDNRRGVTKKIEKNRGLTKSRPKDRKTPHTNRKAKYKKGERKHMAQTRKVKPEDSRGFQGVPNFKPHVTHSRAMF